MRDTKRDKLSKAVAIKYDINGSTSPKVVSKGTGLIAGNIVRSAQ